MNGWILVVVSLVTLGFAAYSYNKHGLDLARLAGAVLIPLGFMIIYTDFSWGSDQFRKIPVILSHDPSTQLPLSAGQMAQILFTVMQIGGFVGVSLIAGFDRMNRLTTFGLIYGSWIINWCTNILYLIMGTKPAAETQAHIQLVWNMAKDGGPLGIALFVGTIVTGIFVAIGGERAVSLGWSLLFSPELTFASRNGRRQGSAFPSQPTSRPAMVGPDRSGS